MTNFCVYVCKRSPANIEAEDVLKDIIEMGINSIKSVNVTNRYLVSGITEKEFKDSIYTVFAEKNIDDVTYELTPTENYRFAVASLPGQFNQREQAAVESLQLVTSSDRPIVKTAKIYTLESESITDDELKRVKNYIINSVDSEEVEVNVNINDSLSAENLEIPKTVITLHGFISMDDSELKVMIKNLGLAMNLSDLECAQVYYRDKEKRDPSITEIKCLDTFWSDHCRHTTFLTEIENIDIEDGYIMETFEQYLETKNSNHSNKPVCLMDLATLAAKHLEKNGYILDLDSSDEINACSIVISVKKPDGEIEEWLLMFKNETHNHPTEIEPFGGAATCLGGAIRDPLSGRTFVYQSMRITGSADPNESISETLKGKLPQRYITKTAAKGFHSYGNQIGLATGLVDEIYHPGYKAKRMEIGAVLGAAPRKNVVRETPQPGDVVVLLGGLTGNDGIGGATGASKEHTEESSTTCGAEVQKGNPPVERAIQRLFKDSELTTMIKRCNDFGAGGVCVAVGEIADSLKIYLDNVPKKYQGLDGTAIAISESQERMAVVIAAENLDEFILKCNQENIRATHIADVTDDGYMRMFWENNEIVCISREFLNSNGATRKTDIYIPKCNFDFNNIGIASYSTTSIEEMLLNKLASLQCCSRRGLNQQFDSTIGAGTILLPYGGKTQDTPIQAMVSRIPTENFDTTTCSIMSYGFDPRIGDLSPYHMGIYSVVESLSKIAATGGDTTKVRLSLQEYFPRLRDDSERWGKAFNALLGAFKVQMELNVPAIGGKDSMSGSFENIDVPSTLVSFAVTTCELDNIVSPELKPKHSTLFLFRVEKDINGVPDFEVLKEMYAKINKLVNDKEILAAYVVGVDGIAVALSKMGFGNNVGFKVGNENLDLFRPEVGSIIVQTEADLSNIAEYVGYITNTDTYCFKNEKVSLLAAKKVWSSTLESVFPVNSNQSPVMYDSVEQYNLGSKNKKSIIISKSKPQVVIPVFPGTNCEYDLKKKFVQAGADVEFVVINNLTKNGLEDSMHRLAQTIKSSQIIMLPGGFSAGDEPDGSGKYMVATFKNNMIKEATMELLYKKDGLILGICNGFQALIKLGLLPYGEIRDIDEESPTLIVNSLGRHISRMVTTSINSNLSPWLSYCNVGDTHEIAISHGEGRFHANPDVINELNKSGQIATLYVDYFGNFGSIDSNPNGSVCAIEGITSKDGRVFGKMGHSERFVEGNYLNIPGTDKDQNIFKAGADYFKI